MIMGGNDVDAASASCPERGRACFERLDGGRLQVTAVPIFF
jgi:hypothetical protein